MPFPRSFSCPSFSSVLVGVVVLATTQIGVVEFSSSSTKTWVFILVDDDAFFFLRLLLLFLLLLLGFFYRGGAFQFQLAADHVFEPPSLSLSLLSFSSGKRSSPRLKGKTSKLLLQTLNLICLFFFFGDLPCNSSLYCTDDALCTQEEEEQEEQEEQEEEEEEEEDRRDDVQWDRAAHRQQVSGRAKDRKRIVRGYLFR